jgi:hypothetical protein
MRQLFILFLAIFLITFKSGCINANANAKYGKQLELEHLPEESMTTVGTKEIYLHAHFPSNKFGNTNFLSL